jgi:hypothetical protein
MACSCVLVLATPPFKFIPADPVTPDRLRLKVQYRDAPRCVVEEQCACLVDVSWTSERTFSGTQQFFPDGEILAVKGSGRFLLRVTVTVSCYKKADHDNPRVPALMADCEKEETASKQVLIL